MNRPTPRRRRSRRVAVVTGTRAEYGLLQSTLEAIRRRRGLELHLIVTGMHLVRKFGYTVRDIEDNGWPIAARIKMQTGDDSPLDQAKGLARGVAGIATYCEQADIDILLVLGDRIEAMAGAMAAVTTGRVLAHVHGGDLAQGDLDDTLRHAITKLAHIHLAATASSARRIVRMGEDRRRVHMVGAPGLDRLHQILGDGGFGTGRSHEALVVYHPCGDGAVREKRAMHHILSAVKQSRLGATVIYPNSDRGHRGIIEAIERIGARRTAKAGTRGTSRPQRSPDGDRERGDSAVSVVRSLPRDEYLRRLIEADVLVGNSSSGIIEAATAGTPVVNIGPRQRGRRRQGRSVIDTEASIASIREAIGKALRRRPIRGGRSVYGDGRAGQRIADVLARVSLTNDLRRKLTTY